MWKKKKKREQAIGIKPAAFSCNAIAICNIPASSVKEYSNYLYWFNGKGLCHMK